MTGDWIVDIALMMDRLESTNYYDVGFRQVIEDHLGAIKNGSTEMVVTPHAQAKYDGNLYGLLAEFSSMSIDYFWIVMRCNDFVSPRDYRLGMSVLLVPNEDYIRTLYNTYITFKK